MKGKLLYIEDNEQNFYLVSFILTRRGHEVIWAKDGPAGIEAALAHRPQVILLDIQLPGMDGYEVARALRERAELRATPVIALTSYAMPGDRAKAFQGGFTGYVEKPIDPSTFAIHIESFLPAAAGGGGRA